MWHSFFAMKESHPSFSNKDALYHSSHLWALVSRCTTYAWALICLCRNWIFLQTIKWFRLSVTVAVSWSRLSLRKLLFSVNGSTKQQAENSSSSQRCDVDECGGGLFSPTEDAAAARSISMLLFLHGDTSPMTNAEHLKTTILFCLEPPLIHKIIHFLSYSYRTKLSLS